MALAVWANSIDVHGDVCFDARLRGQADGPRYPSGTVDGQGGWDMGFRFSNLADLARQLHTTPHSLPAHVCGNWIDNCPSIRRGQVTRLAIMAHGVAGQLFLAGQSNPPLTTDDIPRFHTELHNVGLSTSRSATILIMGCLVAQGLPGTLFLQALSVVWPGRLIVGFVTIGYAPGGAMLRTADTCAEPGMRDTWGLSGSLDNDVSAREYGPHWNNLVRLPWASETSPHAKTVRDGIVLRNANL